MIGHIAPEAALGGPIAVVREGDSIVIDVDRKALDLEVPADEIARRLAHVVAAGAALRGRRHGQVRGARRVGVRGRGHDRAADAGQPARPVSDGERAGLDRDQDLAPGGRLADAGRRLGADRRARRLRLGLDERPPDRRRAGARRARRGRRSRRWRRSSTTCPGKWVGHAVLSATFRHPSVLAKAATVMDHATGGRFILGLGAGWFEPEHTPFGIPYPPMPERFDRFESAVHTIRAMGSADAATPEGVTRAGPVLPARRRDQRPAAADAGRSADLARRPEATRHRARRRGRRRAGCCRPSRRTRTRPT